MKSESAIRRAAEIALVLGAFSILLQWVPPVAHPVSALIAYLLLRLAGQKIADTGFTRAHFNFRTALLGALLAAAIVLAAKFVLIPASEFISGEALDTQRLREAVATPAGLATMLVMSWVYAAFGEEWCFRLFPLTRVRDTSPPVQWLVLLASSAIFGSAHVYQGWPGVFLSGSIGFILGASYILSSRNAWLVVLAHGLVDTTAFVLFYLNLF